MIFIHKSYSFKHHLIKMNDPFEYQQISWYAPQYTKRILNKKKFKIFLEVIIKAPKIRCKQTLSHAFHSNICTHAQFEGQTALKFKFYSFRFLKNHFSKNFQNFLTRIRRIFEDSSNIFKEICMVVQKFSNCSTVSLIARKKLEFAVYNFLKFN